MALGKVTRRRMYAISLEGVGLIAGTLAYSRTSAIECFLRPDYAPSDWEKFKASGYRTVQAVVETVGKYGRRRTTRQ
jgi:hypothetical protein